MLKKLILSEEEKAELARYGQAEIKRGGFDLIIWETDKYNDTNYDIHVRNPYDHTSIDKQMDDYYEKNKQEGKSHVKRM